MLRLAFVTGTEPGKWFARYRAATAHGLDDIPSDDPLALVESGEANAALMRLPDARVGRPGETYHCVQLYDEAPGIAVPKDSVYAEVGEAVSLNDVSDEHVNLIYTEPSVSAAPDSSPVPSMPTVGDLRAALQVVAANVGVAFAPAPLLKALSKKQVKVLGLVPADGRDSDDPNGQRPELFSTQIALVWPVAKDSDAIQDFVGVAKGRTVNSSRNVGGGGASSSGARGGKGNQKRGHARDTEKKRNNKLKGETPGRRKGFVKNHPKKGVRRKRS